MLSQASFMLGEAILKPRLVGKKFSVNVSKIWWGSFRNFIYPCVMVFSEETDSLGIQIFLT